MGAAQICWLSELALYDFDIIYRTGKSNLVADALSRWPESPSNNRNSKEYDSDEDWEAISYPVTHTGQVSDDLPTISSSVISHDITTLVGGVKIQNALRERIEMVGAAYEEMGETDPINIQSHVTEVFNQIPPEQMAEYQRVDNHIGPILPWVREGKIPPKSILYKVKSKTCHKLYFQIDRLVLKQGVLHRLHIHKDMEYHQLVLPQRLHSKVLGSVHDNMGHQGVERMLELLRECVY